jgi:hypothetical protein
MFCYGFVGGHMVSRSDFSQFSLSTKSVVNTQITDFSTLNPANKGFSPNDCLRNAQWKISKVYIFIMAK